MFQTFYFNTEKKWTQRTYTSVEKNTRVGITLFSKLLNPNHRPK